MSQLNQIDIKIAAESNLNMFVNFAVKQVVAKWRTLRELREGTEQGRNLPSGSKAETVREHKHAKLAFLDHTYSPEGKTMLLLLLTHSHVCEIERWMDGEMCMCV